MSRRWIKIAVSQLAIAGFGMAGLADRFASADDLPPVVTAEAARQLDEETLAEERPILDVTNIPSVFESNESSVQPVAFSLKGGCDSKCDTACDTACGSQGCSTPSCVPWWAHRSGGFGELLYLSPGNSDLIYAVEQTGPVPKRRRPDRLASATSTNMSVIAWALLWRTPNAAVSPPVTLAGTVKRPVCFKPRAITYSIPT